MKQSRLAVSVFFFVTGFLFAMKASRFPELEAFWRISHTQLGSLLFLSAVGSVLSMPFVGWLSQRFGSKFLVPLVAFVMCALESLVAFSPYPFVGVIFFALGVVHGTCDVMMNEQAVFVERAYSKPIMSSFHAVFSIGMAIGAGIGALCSYLQLPLTTHFILGAILCTIGVFWAQSHLLEMPSDLQKSDSSAKNTSFTRPSGAILLLGFIAFCCMTGEGAMTDWSALFVTKIVKENAFWGAFSVGTFALAMTTGRVFGDFATQKFGKKQLLVGNTLLALFGLGLMLSVIHLAATLIGLLLIGLGLSTIVPTVYSTAGNTEGISPSAGIAMATTIGYAGFFVGPPTIGYLADIFDMRISLMFVWALFFVMLVLSSRIK